MSGRQVLERTSHFGKIFEFLSGCTERGFHVFNEKTASFEYICFQQMYIKAIHYAGSLRARGITKDNQVLVSAATTPNLASIWLGLIMLGAIPIPVVPRESLTSDSIFINRLKHIITHVDIYLCNELEKDLINRYCENTNTPCYTIQLDTLELDHPSFNETDIRIPHDSDTGLIQFTSGSTGTPRGIIITYEALLTNIQAMWTRLHVDTSSVRAASWLPLYHDMGLVGYFLGCLFTGTELVLMSSMQFAKRPLQFLKVIDDYEVRICSMPNFALDWILKRYNHDKAYDFNLSSLYWLGVGAEPVDIITLKSFYDVFKHYGLSEGVISPCYGLAEATLAVSIAEPYRGYRISDITGQAYTTAGIPVNGVEIKIESEQENTIGILKIRGTSVASYALINGKKERILDDDGFYDTGDYGYFDGDELAILGRSDDMFIINGENFFPYEIEQLVKQFAFTVRNRAVAFAYQHCEKSEKRLVVLYETRDLDEDSLEFNNDFLHKQIVRATGLHPFEVMGVPPRTIKVTPSGKIKRNAMRTWYLNKKDTSYDKIC